MGSVKTRRLLDANFLVLPHDIDLAKCRKAEPMGALPGPPEQMARACEQVVLALFETSEVEAMVRGDLASSGCELVVICTSTCDPLRIAILAAGCGPLRFLEAPVSGTSEQV